MRRNHRRAHFALALASAAASAWLLGSAWAMRTRSPEPTPVTQAGNAKPASEWAIVLDTPQGPAVAAYSSGPWGSRLYVSLPEDLDAAEPGLVLEAAGALDTLGGVNAVRPYVPAPQMPEGGGTLVLVDLARGLRLGDAPLPRSRR